MNNDICVNHTQSLMQILRDIICNTFCLVQRIFSISIVHYFHLHLENSLCFSVFVTIIQCTFWVLVFNLISQMNFKIYKLRSVD